MALEKLQTGRGPHKRLRATVGLAAACTALAAAGLVNAIDDASLSIERVSGDGWSAEDIVVELELPHDRTLARIARLHLTSVSQELRDVRIDCPHLELSDVAIACARARIVVADWPGIGAQSFTAKVVYGRRDGSLELAAESINLGKGTAAIEATLRRGGWSAKTHLQRVPIDVLMKLAGELGLPVPPFSASGLVTLSAVISGAQRDLHGSTFTASFVDLTANNESGSLATDKLSVSLQGSVRKSAGDWRFSVELRSAQGQAYLQPIFLDLGAHALAASAQGKLRGARELRVERFTLDHANVAQASGGALVDFAQEKPLRSLALQLASLEFPGAYESYLQPLLLDTNFKSMQTAGKIAGALTIEGGAPQSIDLTLDDITFDDGARKFALDALHGLLHWRPEPESGGDDDDSSATVRNAAQSALSWRSGAIFGLSIGAGDLHFSTSGRQFRLLQPTRIALLDGAVAFDSFRVRNAGMPSVSFMVDATLTPIDVQRLCKAFGWPEFGGQLGGTISKLRMREGVVTLGTVLRAQVFDGDVTISDLRLQQPFGKWPRLYSSIALDNLDLELVTGAFSFGRMTGRLSGRIEELRLFNWAPVAFDARLYTPADDRSRHRISQRAVQNIGNIGGGGAGVAAALSSGFLRFFDDFNYDRLGLSCRLENDVCAMDGVAPAPNGGYYLVKGKGVPRIDVIGSSRRVDWPRLVQQLITATKSGGPTVE